MMPECPLAIHSKALLGKVYRLLGDAALLAACFDPEAEEEFIAAKNEIEAEGDSPRAQPHRGKGRDPMSKMTTRYRFTQANEEPIEMFVDGPAMYIIRSPDDLESHQYAFIHLDAETIDDAEALAGVLCLLAEHLRRNFLDLDSGKPRV
jgi:hypothetical protein